MTWYRVGPAGIPGSLKTDMDAVLNKKFGTSTTYAPSTWPDDVNLLGPLPEKTASGAIAHIEDGADGVPLKNWLVNLPASLDGYTSVNGTKIASNNLMSFPEVDFTYKNVRYYTVDGILYLDGTSTGETSPDANEFKALSFFLKAGTYYFNRGALALPSYIYKKSDGTQLRVNNGSFTLAEDTECNFGFYIYNKTFSNSKADLCLNIGNTAITYTDTAAPTTATVSLGRTIYGGTADIVTGEGKNGYSGIVALNSLNWAKTTISGHSAFYAALPNGYLPTGSSGFDGACDSYEVTQDTTLGTDKTIRFYYNSSYNFSRCIVRDDDYASATAPEFKQAVTGNIVYKLADSAVTPFTFDPITPTPETALGVNNFWADEGDSDVTYRADISLALQALGGGGRGLMGMLVQRPEEEQLTETEEDPEEVPEETETDER